MCEEFKCAWLEDLLVPDKIKPDIAGIIAYTDPNKVYLIIKSAGNVVTEEYRSWAKMYADKLGLQYFEGK